MELARLSHLPQVPCLTHTTTRFTVFFEIYLQRVIQVLGPDHGTLR